MAKKLKIGVIGLGSIGTVHMDAYRLNTDAAELTAICDINADRLKAQGEKYAVAQQFTDYRQLLKTDVDCISVCTWNLLHKEMATAAFKAGKNVLLEKPMAMNAKEGAEILAAGKKAKKILQIGMVWRQAAEAQLARQYVADGLLGEIYHIRAVLTRRRGVPGLGGWFTTKSMSGGGPLIDIGVHWFDICMYMSGLWNPTSVSAVTYSKFGCKMRDYKYVGMWAGPPNFKGVCDVEDYAAGFVRFGKKATMSFEISWAGNTEEQGFVELIGDKGGMRVLDGKPVQLKTEYEGRIADITPQYQDVPNRFAVQTKKYLAACRGEGEPAATGEQGVINMKLIDAVYASSKAGTEVKIR